MARRADCIFCGKNTGSREHSFPAGLGGRRQNKCILCATCNNKFSDLDGILAQQLSMINGLLGVRPDHDNEVIKAELTNPLTGEVVKIDANGKPSMAAARVISDEMINGRRRLNITCSSEQQVKEWLASMRAQGIDPKEISRRKERQFFPTGIEGKWTFGGADAFREIGRIALNFLAHRWPDLARAKELQPFKKYVLGHGGDFVWYDFQADITALPENAFPFGHRVLLGLDGSAGDAYARVSLFSTFELAVWFGKLRCPKTFTFIVDIDPLANHPPDDIKQVEREGEALVPVTAPILKRPFTTEMHARFAQLLNRIDEKQWTILIDDLFNKVSVTSNMPSCVRENRILELLGDYEQQLFNLMTYCADGLKNALLANPQTAEFARVFDQFIEADPSARTGLTMMALCTIKMVRYQMAARISEMFDVGTPPTKQDLHRLLHGGEGAALAGRVMTEFVNIALERRVVPDA